MPRGGLTCAYFSKRSICARSSTLLKSGNAAENANTRIAAMRQKAQTARATRLPAMSNLNEVTASSGERENQSFSQWSDIDNSPVPERCQASLSHARE